MDSPPQSTYAELLLRRGVPATMLTPVGHLPAVIVFLTDRPSAERLVEAFGGTVMTPASDTSGLVVWTGVGRAAARASLVATRAISQSSGHLHPDREEAWRALLAFARIGSANPPDPSGRRPKSVYADMRRLAARIDRLLARQADGYGDVVDGMAQLVTLRIEDGTLADDLRPPDG